MDKDKTEKMRLALSSPRKSSPALAELRLDTGTFIDCEPTMHSGPLSSGLC